jgi:hypothetical protein
MFKDYFISNGPFIDTPSIASQISNILAYMTTHCIPKQDQRFAQHYKFWH